MFNFLIFRKFFQKGGVNTDDSWKCLYPLMLITATCTFISYFMPFWSFDEACSRGIFFDCCRREFENSTLCHNAKWLTKEHLSETLIAAIVVGLAAVAGTLIGTVTMLVMLVRDLKSDRMTTRSIIFMGFANGSLLVSSCLLLMQEIGYHAVGASFWLCLTSGVVQILPIAGCMLSRQLVGF